MNRAEQNEFRGWSLRKVAQALGISPGALHKYIKGGYVTLPAPDPLDSSLLLQPDGVREAIFASELFSLLPRDNLHRLDPLREGLEQLRGAVSEAGDPDTLVAVLLGQEVRFLREQDLPKTLPTEVLGHTGKVVVLALGRRHRAVMTALREMKPRGPEKA